MWVKKSMKSKYSIYILLHIAIIVMWSFFYKFNLITNDAVEINALSIMAQLSRQKFDIFIMN